MDLTLTNNQINDMEEKQQKDMNDWILTKLPPQLLLLLDGVDNVTDISSVYISNLYKCGYDKIIMIPIYDDMDDEWIYKPMFAMTALATFIGHKRPEDVVNKTLKNHQVLLGAEIDKGSAKRGPPIIFHEGLTEANFRQTKYISFNSARHLIMVDMKRPQFREQAAMLNQICDDILELMPRLFKRMNRIIAEYRHKDQQKELLELQRHKAFVDSEKRRQALMYKTITLKKESYLYAFTTPSKWLAMEVKLGIATDKDARLSTLRTTDHDGYYIHVVNLYNAKTSETQLHEMLNKYQLKIDREWYRIPSEGVIKDLLNTIQENESKLYDNGYEIPECIRLALGVRNEDLPQIAAIPDPPVKDFIQDIIKEVNNETYKTKFEQTVRAIKKREKYSQWKNLPINIDEFIELGIEGIAIRKEVRGSRTKIIIEITEGL